MNKFVAQLLEKYESYAEPAANAGGANGGHSNGTNGRVCSRRLPPLRGCGCARAGLRRVVCGGVCCGAQPTA